MAHSRQVGKAPRQQRGIGLIEVLIAMFVLAFGVLALSKMQGEFFGESAASKARSEALAIAQGRLEDMRNYMHEADTLAEFNALYPAAAGLNQATINGVNASFSRSENISAAAGDDIRRVEVEVQWQDQAGETQSVSLNTEISFVPPGAPGALAAVKDEFKIRAPTGRAELGKGRVPEGASTTSNGDGTAMYLINGDRNLVLGDKIVLTLRDACNSATGSCTDFVEIHGKVYVDLSTQRNLPPEDVYVHASDAAFCSRYYIDSQGNSVAIDANSNLSGNPDLLTDKGDYAVFNYTCYLGGGWHGNIGLLLPGGLGQGDKICQGDPASTNGWEEPVIAARRAYRGMLYQKDSFDEPITDGEGDIIYSSYGIADGVVLPDPDSGDHTHDFVISSMSTAKTEGSHCITEGIMIRADANIGGVDGDLFRGNPDDFVCLNDGNLDTYNTDIHGHYSTCPYDPTDPPVERHIISGVVEVALNIFSGFDSSILDSVVVDTSDGPGNCRLGGFSDQGDTYTASYQCDGYDWGSGWTGNIFVTATDNEDKLSCTPNPQGYEGIGADTAGKNFDCSPGRFAVIFGQVDTINFRKVLSKVQISAGSCRLNVDGLSYICISDAYNPDWDGTVTFTAADGVICPATGTGSSGSLVLDSSGVATATGITSKNQLNINIRNSLKQCP
ncbi:prepilin-type N-terminal cleavage/methylation domain-containing protein [Microbulbifer aestuariivivens]